MSRACRAPSGAALPLVLLALLVLAVSAGSLVFLASQELRIADGRLAHLRARYAAQAGAATVRAGWRSSQWTDLAVGERRPGASGAQPGDARFTTEVERLAAGLFLVRSYGEAPAGRYPVRTAAGLLIRALSPDELTDALPAGLSSAGFVAVGAGGVLESAGDTCGGAGAALVEAGRVVEGIERITAALLLAPDAGAIGPPLSMFAGSADAEVAGPLVIGPQLAGSACDTGVSTNWGDPVDAGSPCAAHFPLIRAPGDLELVAGIGQGILIVEGDLHVRAAVRFSGAILVGGRLLLEPGALISGGVRAGSPADTAFITGTLRHDRCALGGPAASPSLQRPFAPGARRWIALFHGAEKV